MITCKYCHKRRMSRPVMIINAKFNELIKDISMEKYVFIIQCVLCDSDQIEFQCLFRRICQVLNDRINLFFVQQCLDSFVFVRLSKSIRENSHFRKICTFFYRWLIIALFSLSRFRIPNTNTNGELKRRKKRNRRKKKYEMSWSSQRERRKKKRRKHLFIFLVVVRASIYCHSFVSLVQPALHSFSNEHRANCITNNLLFLDVVDVAVCDRKRKKWNGTKISPLLFYFNFVFNEAFSTECRTE